MVTRSLGKKHRPGFDIYRLCISAVDLKSLKGGFTVHQEAAVELSIAR